MENNLYNIDVGTYKGLEWYGSLDTYVGSGVYMGPDTVYYFCKQEMVYVDTGENSGNLSYGDLANGIFSGKYPMTDPIPKDYYCITATKVMEGDTLKTWYFKVLPYEYAAPAKVNAEICGRDLLLILMVIIILKKEI